MRLHPLHQPEQGVAGNPPRRVASALDAPRPPANAGESPNGGPAVLVDLPKAHEKRKPAASAEGRGDVDHGGRTRVLHAFEESRLRFRRAADPAQHGAIQLRPHLLGQVAEERQHLADNSLGVPILGGGADERPDAWQGARGDRLTVHGHGAPASPSRSAESVSARRSAR